MDTKIESSRAMNMPATARLAKPIAFIKGHSKLWSSLAVVIVGGLLAFYWWGKRSNTEDYVMDHVTRGSIEVAVSATGTVQAVTTVQVGSQVSGTVLSLGADFKSSVKQGQVIARLDPALFQAQVDTAKANLQNAQAGVQAAQTEIANQRANVEAAKANDLANQAARDDAISIAKQNEKLRGIIPEREIQSAENASRVAVARYSQASSQIGQAQAQLQIAQSKLKQAQAAVAQANAQLAQANVNLQHTIISSPIDGVVVSRSVDVGQTVAASLSAPTLFTIANDLTSMQVLASIDEADVGQVREKGKATFTVDAFSGQRFSGDIVQVRLNAQTLQNVVTYTAVISVSNPEQKLMPGMTANITIPVARRDDVLRVPNSTLRFKPDLTEQQQKDLQTKMDAFRQQQASQGNGESDRSDTDKSSKDSTSGTDAKSGGEGAAASGNKHRGRDGGGGGNGGEENAGPGKGGAGRGDKHGDKQGDNPGDKKSGRKKTEANANANASEVADGAEQPPSEEPDQTGAAAPRKGKHKPEGDQAAAGSPKSGRRHSDGSDQAAADGSKHGRRHGPPEDQKGAKNSDRKGGKSEAKNANSDGQKPAAAADTQAGGGRGSGRQRQQIQVIWTMTATKTLEPHFVRVGITDGRFTEISGSDLKEGDTIVIGQTGGSSANSNRPPTTPFQQQRPPAAGGGGGRGR
jgi:HlyD family secretion protein